MGETGAAPKVPTYTGLAKAEMELMFWLPEDWKFAAQPKE